MPFAPRRAHLWRGSSARGRTAPGPRCGRQHRTAPHWAGRAARSSKLFQQNWQVAGTTAEGLARRVQADA
ncbi:hypothetical protein D3F03_07895 [Simplicispira hankyongi]|uniref:Uncharacterized protein n=1 Tax=Simplicispira hankyongi TaxID=2315688 RepID=A0A398C581_9BURK|nr:hypothetical protein D3F03_07895 [Simplicispira hankyongi]